MLLGVAFGMSCWISSPWNSWWQRSKLNCWQSATKVLKTVFSARCWLFSRYDVQLQVQDRCDRRLYVDELPPNFLCDEHLKNCRSIVVQTLNDDYFAFLSHPGRLKFFRSALQGLAKEILKKGADVKDSQVVNVLDLGAGAGQLSLLILDEFRNLRDVRDVKVLALEACSEFCRLAEQTLKGHEGHNVQHALSCCVELDTKMDVLLCEPYDIFLTGDVDLKMSNMSNNQS